VTHTVTLLSDVTGLRVPSLQLHYMDDRNNRSIPQDRQNLELTNTIPVTLNRFVEGGVTPEQFAENARQLESFSRMNAMALQVYLQRQSQQAEQRRQDE
jgi:hypothetical protein